MLSISETSFGARLQQAVKEAGGITIVASELERGKSTLYTWFAETSSPSVADALKICVLGRVRPAWLMSGDGVMRDGESGADAAVQDDDVVEIPVLATTASAGSGSVPTEVEEERGSVAFPRAWARAFGTPARLRLVEIVGDSMTPDLNPGDWMLIDLDQVELRDGIALVRLDDALMVKRLQPQGRTVLLTSTNEKYHPIPVDLKTEAERFAIIGRGRWATKTLP